LVYFLTLVVDLPTTKVESSFKCSVLSLNTMVKDNTLKGANNMENYKNLVFELDSQLVEIKSETEIARGALEVLKELVEKMQHNAEVSSYLVKDGSIQRKLYSLLILLDYSILNISKVETEANNHFTPIFEYFRDKK